jgi:hypothetical protein
MEWQLDETAMEEIERILPRAIIKNPVGPKFMALHHRGQL